MSTSDLVPSIKNVLDSNPISWDADGLTTVYSDPVVNLTVQAWRRNLCSWHLLFRIADQYSMSLNETAVFYFFRRFPDWHIQPPGGWAKHHWSPATDRRVSAQALAAVEAWLAEQEANA